MTLNSMRNQLRVFQEELSKCTDSDRLRKLKDYTSSLEAQISQRKSEHWRIQNFGCPYGDLITCDRCDHFNTGDGDCGHDAMKDTEDA